VITMKENAGEAQKFIKDLKEDPVKLMSELAKEWAEKYKNIYGTVQKFKQELKQKVHNKIDYLNKKIQVIEDDLKEVEQSNPDPGLKTLLEKLLNDPDLKALADRASSEKHLAEAKAAIEKDDITGSGLWEMWQSLYNKYRENLSKETLDQEGFEDRLKESRLARTDNTFSDEEINGWIVYGKELLYIYVDPNNKSMIEAINKETKRWQKWKGLDLSILKPEKVDEILEESQQARKNTSPSKEEIENWVEAWDISKRRVDFEDGARAHKADAEHKNWQALLSSLEEEVE
jgi:hypothetical protein